MYDDHRLSAEQIEVLLGAAVAAPSMHNTQPWRFEVSGRVIDLYLDGSRALPAEDPTGRAMRIAAGAATFNLRCAAASMGYGSWFGLAPDPNEPDLVVRVVVEPGQEPDRTLRQLFTEIPRRHTSRGPVRPVPLTPDDRISLTRAALTEQAELTWLQPAAVKEVLGLVVDTDLRQLHDRDRAAERAHWIGGDRGTDGVPSSALGPRPVEYPAPVRDLGAAPADRLRPQAAFEGDPVLAVLSTEDDHPADQLAAGLALERVLLTATRQGLIASFLNQPLEYEDLRGAVQRSTGKSGHAHMIIRLGHGTTANATPRHPVSDFLRSGPES